MLRLLRLVLLLLRLWLRSLVCLLMWRPLGCTLRLLLVQLVHTSLLPQHHLLLLLFLIVPCRPRSRHSPAPVLLPPG